ncbi:MAG TPA: hypothetical protein PK207_06295 [Candidatus Aminicenantes bacterium]|jgi:hypothetical protein|nr:hypothetical protein [Candidatus Aminicenantes bacterium]
MKRELTAAFLLTVLAVSWAAAAPPASDMDIWKEFLQLLKSGTLTVDWIHPDDPRTRESRLTNLLDWTKDEDWSEWRATPKVVRQENFVSFIVEVGKKRRAPWTYVFCFTVEGGRWYYRFVEGVFLRLDQVVSLPADASAFPDLSEERKNWMRQEIYWTKIVGLFTEMTRLKGTEYALGFLRDGKEYVQAATSWIPYFPAPRAFILYLCWEQARLHGNKVVLEKLTDREAVVRFDDHQFFALYMQTSHLREQIALGDYMGIFEAIWQDRARAAGWNLQIDGQGPTIYLRFSR